jgi:putative SOS response-associated peptidase YedK
MFKTPYAQRRCVVPSTGFYEWRRDERGKPVEKFLFNEGEAPMLYMAAVYTEYSDDVPLKERFAILTREANGSMRDIHDRMPVILRKTELTRWLTDRAFADTALKRDDVMLRKRAV